MPCLPAVVCVSTEEAYIEEAYIDHVALLSVMACIGNCMEASPGVPCKAFAATV